MTYKILNTNNLKAVIANKYDLIYADMIYEDTNIYPWINYYWQHLKKDGIFIVQTDWHTDWLIRGYFEEYFEGSATFINHLVWKNEWGNHPKNKFHQCYDDIIIYAKGKNYKFYPERIQIDKVTKNKGLNPSGRQTKTATAWIDDICLTTTSKERIKKSDGHLVQWQKPLKLFDRIITPFTDEGDDILDPFMGVATLGEWCLKNNRNYVGVEIDKEIFQLAKKRLEKIND
jgi:DNA modification methylase